MRFWVWIAVAMTVGAVGCGGGGDGGPVEGGEQLYREPLESGNTFACATCHALEEPAADGFRRPGHPIGDAVRRPSYKNGRYVELRAAVNTCVEHWMNGEPFREGERRWRALRGFLEAQAPAGEAPALSYEIVDPPADPSGGDAAAGEALFDRSCAICHGEGASGTTRAPSLAGLRLDAEYVARRVRTSGATDNPAYDGLTGGIMPFWAADRLSDEELRDVIAFVLTLNRPPMDGGVPPADGGVGDAGVGADAAGADAGLPSDAGLRSCDSTHAKVGQSAVLTTRFHDVMGTARIVDDCTIVVENFHYDGGGIVVELYGGLGGDYVSGFSMTDDLARATPYEGETLTAQLPEGKTLDDLDGVSVWCVDVGVSFGDGMFGG